MNNLNSFSTKEELLEVLSSNIIKILQESIDKKGKATILLSGGNTPKPLLEKLSKCDLDWEKVFVALVDERWVSHLHHDSNEKLVETYLLQNKAKKATFTGMYIDGKTAIEAEKTCSKIYKQKLFPFDLVILGMGSDSHTASLFPQNERLSEAYDLENENLCIAIKPKTAPHDRMSLTLMGILSAENIILHIEGEEKLKVYEEALVSDDIFKTPISAVLNNNKTKVEVYHA